MKKNNQLVIGLIILLIALICAINPSEYISIGAVMSLVCAFAFLLLYWTKRKTWSLVLGGYMLYIGLSESILQYIPESISVNFTAAMFFVVPALIFFVLYFDKSKRNLLVPASLLLWFGVFVLVVPLLPVSGAGLLPLCFALAFLTMYVIGRGYIGRWALFFAAFFALIALPLLLRIGNAMGIFSVLSKAVAVILVIISIFLIARSLKR